MRKLKLPVAQRRDRSVATAAEPSDGQLLQRFTAEHDQTAFAAVVARHGPMVLGVCRRILKDWHDAADAFQATFLVLVRKAGSLSRPELLGNWLYGVACRTAVRAKARAARRRAHERGVAAMAIPAPTTEGEGPDFREELDEELNSLPEKYRTPLVLCYLQGRSNAEAARLLGCPAGSMSWRLAKAREALRQRLVRRNPACTAAPLTLILTEANTSVPAALAESTVHVAGLFVSGAGGIPGSVIELANEVLGSISWRRPPWSLTLLAALLTAVGVGTLAASALGPGSTDGKKAAVSQPSAQEAHKDRLGSWPGRRVAR